MGLFGDKSVRCPAGQWTTLVKNFGSGYPRTFIVRLAGDGPIRGQWVEKRHWWIFPQKETVGELASELRFERYWINAIYSIRICPEHDVVATVT